MYLHAEKRNIRERCPEEQYDTFPSSPGGGSIGGGWLVRSKGEHGVGMAGSKRQHPRNSPGSLEALI